MTTSFKVGSEFNLFVKGSDISIVGAEKKTDSIYTITSQTIKIEGEVQSLECWQDQLTSLTLERCSSLTELICPWNQIASLDLSSCTALTKLDCSGLDATTLDLSHNTALTELFCTGLQVTSLDLSHNKALKVFYSEEVSMTKLDFSHNTALEEMVANEGPLKSLTLPTSKTLRVLDYTQTEVGDIDVSNYPALEELWCGINDLTHLDVSNNRRLKILACFTNKLTSLDLSNNPALETLYCNENQLTSLNVSNLPALTFLDCSDGQLTSLDLSNNPALKELYCSNNQLTSLELSKQTALELVWCYKNLPTTLDLANCPNLTILNCSNNLLTKLELANCSNLTKLNCENNLLPKLELPSCPNLSSIDCYGNLILANEMTNLVKALPDRNDKPSWKGWFNVFDSSSSDEKNVCYTYHVDIANAKGWAVIEQTETGNGLYRGKPTPTYEVTISANEEGGTILTAGAKDLKMVPYGTDLFIVDNPKEGYELTALTANGTDILATKKVFISGHTIIKATFAKKTFAVTLTKEGEGTITATGAADLTAVPEGTELTIEATPAAGYELKALTANGTDILASKKVIVKEAVEVKATFTKKTFAVTFDKVGEGTITATGASNLNSVAYGTELTINATPAAGYELTALTANGTDILASKKVIVKEAVEVKATFTKKTFAVTLTKEGEGTITATGASDLKAVAYGTELTIVATPATGYELVSLDANGTDITATKKVVVKENLTVKATFTKLQKNYVVTLKSNDHGTITIKEDVDLKAVPEGTKLTVVAKGANDKCELTKLTANGEDILKDKTFTVTKDTEVVAVFVDHTGVDAVAADAFVIYPNPASESATVTGLAPEAAVALYTLDGQLIMRLAADRSGRLQIDLTALSDGTYLVVTEGATQRLVVKR
jgi:Leucine-rich repeat (LRR) protein